MSKRLKLAIAIQLALLAIIAAVICWPTENWPAFPDSKTTQPQFVLLAEHDFGVRVGDIISLDLYIQQKPDTQVDVDSLKVDANFEVVSARQVSQRKLPDGSTAYHVHLALQSFQVAPQLSFQASITWQERGVRQRLEIPPLMLSTSRTWDGHSPMKEGTPPTFTFAGYGLKFVLASGLSLALFLSLMVAALERLPAVAAARQLSAASQRMLTLLSAVQEGTCTREQHAELDGLVREHYGVGPLTTNHLRQNNGDVLLVRFLELNDRGLYSREGLDPESRQQLHDTAASMVASWQ